MVILFLIAGFDSLDGNVDIENLSQLLQLGERDGAAHDALLECVYHSAAGAGAAEGMDNARLVVRKELAGGARPSIITTNHLTRDHDMDIAGDDRVLGELGVVVRLVMQVQELGYAHHELIDVVSVVGRDDSVGETNGAHHTFEFIIPGVRDGKIERGDERRAHGIAGNVRAGEDVTEVLHGADELILRKHVHHFDVCFALAELAIAATNGAAEAILVANVF
eukprot:scaffold17583_cov173-Isochrysis_galbana.AAC.4